MKTLKRYEEIECAVIETSMCQSLRWNHTTKFQRRNGMEYTNAFLFTSLSHPWSFPYSIVTLHALAIFKSCKLRLKWTAWKIQPVNFPFTKHCITDNKAVIPGWPAMARKCLFTEHCVQFSNQVPKIRRIHITTCKSLSNFTNKPSNNYLFPPRPLLRCFWKLMVEGSLD